MVIYTHTNIYVHFYDSTTITNVILNSFQVVLSACSSYFQSLFLDHPARHPIVILKDVRFIELRTLIEFMYKGEVNVQYCQLSELLKTAESLKVSFLFFFQWNPVIY